MDIAAFDLIPHGPGKLIFCPRARMDGYQRNLDDMTRAIEQQQWVDGWMA